MSRLGIKMRETGAWLDVPPTARLKVIRENNIFFDGQARRDRTWPIELPTSATNNVELGHLHRPAMGNANASEFKVDVYDGDHLILPLCTLQVASTDTSYNCVIRPRTTSIEEQLAELKLADLPWDDDEFAYLDTPGVWPDVNFAAWNMIIHRKNVDLPHLRTYSTHLCFGAYVKYVLLKISDQLLMTEMTGDFMTDTDMDRLHMVGERGVLWDEPFTTEAVNYTENMPKDMTALEFIDSLCANFCLGRFVNEYTGVISLYYLKNRLTTDAEDWTDRTSGPMHRDWYHRIRQGITFSFDDRAYEAFESPEEPTEDTDLGTRYWLDYVLTETAVNGKLIRIECDRAMMKGLVYEADRGNYYWDEVGAEYVWNENIVTIDGWYVIDYLGCMVRFKDLTIMDPVPDVDALPTPEPKSVVLVQKNNWYYISTPTGWRKYAYNNQPYVHGNGERKVTSSLSPVMIDELGEITQVVEQTNDLYLMPVIKNTSDYARPEATELDGRVIPGMLSFYRGESEGFRSVPETGEEPAPYYLSTPYIYDFAGDTVSDVSLSWDGTSGLFEVFWRPWATFMDDARPVEQWVFLSRADLLNLDMSTPKLIHGVKHVIRSVEIEYPYTGRVKLLLDRGK